MLGNPLAEFPGRVKYLVTIAYHVERTKKDCLRSYREKIVAHISTPMISSLDHGLRNRPGSFRSKTLPIESMPNEFGTYDPDLACGTRFYERQQQTQRKHSLPSVGTKFLATVKKQVQQVGMLGSTVRDAAKCKVGKIVERSEE